VLAGVSEALAPVAFGRTKKASFLDPSSLAGVNGICVGIARMYYESKLS